MLEPPAAVWLERPPLAPPEEMMLLTASFPPDPPSTEALAVLPAPPPPLPEPPQAPKARAMNARSNCWFGPRTFCVMVAPRRKKEGDYSEIEAT
jgi:hypothetical protein